MFLSRPAFPSIKDSWQHIVGLVAVPLLLTGCFEISEARGKVQALAQERATISNDMAAYDKHIEYYKSIVPEATQIQPNKDPLYESLNGYLQRIETELANVKTKMADSDIYLKTLREEAARVRSLQPSE